MKQWVSTCGNHGAGGGGCHSSFPPDISIWKPVAIFILHYLAFSPYPTTVMESLGSVSWPISILALGKWECLFHPLGLQPSSPQNSSAASGPLLEENSFLKETGSYPLRVATGGQRNLQSHLALLLPRGVWAIVVSGLMAGESAALRFGVVFCGLLDLPICCCDILNGISYKLHDTCPG